MKNTLLKTTLLAIGLWLAFPSTAQMRFNRQYDMPYQFQVFTSVHPTDSCYYVTGLVTDTTGGGYRFGNVFLRMGLDGEIQLEKLLASDSAHFETWRGDLLPDGDNRLVDIGYKVDSVRSALLIWYNTEGDTLGTRSFLSPVYPDETFITAAALRKGPDGGYYFLCGIENNPFGFNPDSYLMRLGPDGGLTSSGIYGGPMFNERPYSLLVEDDGGAIIGTSVTNEGFVSNDFYSRTQVFRVGPDGGIDWEYQSPFNQLHDIARDMVATDDGGIVVATGKGIEDIVNPTSSLLKWFPYVFKLDADHEFEWGIELRGTRQDLFSLVKIVPAPDGSGYVGTGRIGEDVSTGEEVLGSWVVKVSPEGDSLWARYYSFFGGIKCRPHPYDLKNTPDGGYVIVGETSPQTPPGAHRAWMMKLDSYGCLIPGCQGVDTVILADGQTNRPDLRLAIYPNPTSDFLNFQLRGAALRGFGNPGGLGGPGRFRITDARGTVVQEFENRTPGATHIVPVRDWTAGIYFLQYLENGEVRATERFVVAE